MMITVQPRRDAATYAKPAFVRALSSITAQQAVTIVQAVQATGDEAWDTQVSDDYDGYRSLLIEGRQRGTQQHCYFVSGTTQHLDLFMADGDHLTSLGCFSHVDHLCDKLVSLIRQQQR